MKATKKNLIIICVSFVLVLTTILILTITTKKRVSDTQTVAFVNGSPIAFAELKMAAESCKSQVVTYFYNTYEAEQGEKFWEKVYGEETPNEKLWSLALDEAVRYKTEQLMMVDYGVVKDISYKTYYKSFIAENKRRLKAIKNDKIIYGPEQYTLKTYFDYVHNNRLIELKDCINKEVSGNDVVDYSSENFKVKYAKVRETVKIKEVKDVAEKLKSDFYDIAFS